MSKESREVVVLLHGLGRRAFAMRRLQKALSADYLVVNESYPSQRHSIIDLAELVVAPLAKRFQHASKLHFVTHSLGGILVRQYCHHHCPENLGRTVMLGPPNQGSELADFFRRLKLYRVINGPAGLQLGTDPKSIPLQLGSVNFDVGIIAGNKSISPFFSRLIVGEDDGKVSVERSKVAGMKDHIVMPTTHTFMMQNSAVIQQVKNYLKQGEFSR